MKRMKIKKSLSKKIFRRTASKPHPKNTAPAPMRGGIRLVLPFVVGVLLCGSFCSGCKLAFKDLTFGIGEAEITKI